MTERTWTELVETIAQNGDLVARLYAIHLPDGDGRCRTCTVAGSFGVRRAWPCTLAELAKDARNLQRKRQRSPG